MPHPAPLTLRGKLEAAAAATAWPKPSRADQLAGLEAHRTGRSAFNYRFATPCIEVRIVGDPCEVGPSTGVTAGNWHRSAPAHMEPPFWTSSALMVIKMLTVQI